MFKSLFTLVFAFAVTLPALADTQEPGQSLTVYNNNFAVVKDVREMNLDPRQHIYQFTDVAKLIDPTSVHFKSLTDPTGTSVLEQNYEFDLISADKMLAKYIDQSISVHTEDGSIFTGDLLSFDHRQLVMKDESGGLKMIQRADNVRNISFGTMPEGLLTRPTLVWQLATQRPGKHMTQVTYQTAGMQWQADYNVVVNADDTLLDLGGWVTLTNRSGATYTDAKIKLIAGDVRKVQTPKALPTRGAVMMEAEALDAGGGGFQQKSFFEYHLYTLGRTTTLKDNQIKQIELLTAAKVPVLKRYVFEPGGRYWHRRHGDKEEYKVNVFLELNNDEASNMGMPLPKGKVRVYKRDAADTGGDDSLEFIGEDLIDHTPKDESLRLYIGDAFDLVGEKSIKEQQQGRRWRDQTIEIKLRNHKESDAVIRVREHMGYGNWTIRDTTHEFEKHDAKTIEFDIPVKAGGEAVLTYKVHYEW